MNKEELEKLLKFHDDLYYNQDEPEISDYEYDGLKAIYVAQYGEYNYVPGEASKNSKKYKHTTNVSSLDKVQITDEENLRSELNRLWPVDIQPKMDGFTLVSYPDEDVTRGNGEVGEIVTENIKKVDGIGTRLQALPIRSEVVMLKSEFNRLNEERAKAGLKLFKNTRNAASGMIRREKESDEIQGLKAYAYNIIREHESNDAHNQLLSLAELGWNVVDSYIPETIDDAMDYILNFDRDSLDYDIDGLVVKHNGPKKFGYTGHHPKAAIAIKFEETGVWTPVTRIVNQVGRTGKITPVVEFKTIDLLGSDVSRATLHNYSIMKAIGLDHLSMIGKHGDYITMVKVIKSNGVIPKVIEVRTPDNDGHNLYVKSLHEPTACPECKSELEKINDQLFCNNSLCPAKVVGALVHMAKRDAFDIEGLSEETAIKLVDYYKKSLNDTLVQIANSEEIMTESDQDNGDGDMYGIISNKINNIHPSFIFELDYPDFFELEGFAKKSAQKLYDNIQASKNIDFNKFLYGCGINLVGRTASKDIASYYSTKSPFAHISMTDDYYVNFKGLKEINGIGDETINSLKNSWETHVVPFGDVLGLNIRNISVAKKAENALTFVITGEFDIKRDIIKAKIEDAGHKVSGSVSKKTDYLLAAPGEEGTSKYKKADTLGIKIINTIEELEALI